MGPRAHGRTLALLVGLALAAGCGSTVASDSAAPTASAPGGSGLQAPAAATPGAVRPGATGTASGITAPGSAPSVAPAAGAGEAAPGVAPASPSGTAPGVTDTEIAVGVGVLENGAEANQAIGSDGISTGDQRRQYQIIFDDVNARGGIAGHTVVPVYYSLDALSGETADAQAQAACSYFTEDNEVFAALGGANDTFLQCMTDAGTVQVTSDLTSSSTERFARFPRYVEVSSPNLERQASVWPGHLRDGGYFDEGAVVGVLSYDDPQFERAVDKALVPALQALGHDAEIVLVTRPESFSGYGAVASGAESAVLRFRSAGVTHVLILDERANLTMFFMQAAQSQAYFPRYGVNTQNAIGFLSSTNPPQVDPEQLHGAVGIGWSQFLDQPQVPDSEGSEPTRRCADLMRDNGITFADRNAEAIALEQCDSVWFLEAALELGGPITAETFQANVARLGGGYLSTMNFANHFGPSQRDGTAAVRRFAFFDDCSCVRYTSDVLPL
jgi:ABC-type branched-subunit amino acid transport system substrate-binding protein